MEERLQKILAQAGFGSRRSCEELISAQRVRVNGKIAQLGSKADAAKDSISVDGQGIPKIAAHMYIALNKPRDVLSDIDPEDPRQTVHDLVKVPGHLFAVGRLDYESEGLILLTNDGELANRLTHPRYGHEKEYHVLVGNRPDDEQLAAWRRGVVLADGTRTRPAEVFIDSLAGKGAWLRVVLREGRKRQIREVGGRIGLPVVRILRVRIGTLLLGELKVGDWRHLTVDEVRRLKSSVEKPVRNLTPRSNFVQPRPDRRSAPGASEEGRSERKPYSGRDSEPGRSERRPGQPPKAAGERSAWKPVARTQGGEDRNEWHPSPRPKSNEDRPTRKPSTWPKTGADSNDRRPARNPDSAAAGSDRGPRRWLKPESDSVSQAEPPVSDSDRVPRHWQKPGNSTTGRSDRPTGGSGHGPRRSQKPGGGPAGRSEHASNDSDRKPHTWQKPGGGQTEHPMGGRPAARPNRSGGRSGGGPKGPRTPRR